MPPRKPTAVVVIAVLQLVFGILGLCSGVIALSGVAQQISAASQQNLPAAQRSLSQDQLEGIIESHVPNYRLVTKGAAGVSCLLALLMVLSGIGLLRLAPWARLLALVYAILSILTTVASAAFNAAFMLPAMPAIAEDVSRQGGTQGPLMAQAMQVAATFGVVMSLVLLIYPIIVLICMLLPSTRAAFRGERLPGDFEDDYRDSSQPGDWSEPDDRYRAGDR